MCVSVLGLPAQSKSGARLDTEREAGVAQHHQQLVRPADRLPDLRVAPDDQLRRDERAALLDHRWPAQSRRHQEQRAEAVAEVRGVVLCTFDSGGFFKLVVLSQLR